MVIDGACGIMLEIGPSGNGYELGGPPCGAKCGLPNLVVQVAPMSELEYPIRVYPDQGKLVRLTPM